MAANLEYKIKTYSLQWKGFDYGKIESELNEFGAEGWEVVGPIVPNFGTGQSIEIAVIMQRQSRSSENSQQAS